MYCAECGLEILSKSKKVKGDNYCESCQERHARRTTIVQATRAETEAASFSSYVDSKPVSIAKPDQYLEPHQNANNATHKNPFADEETYLSHVNKIRKKILLPKIYMILPSLLIILLIFGKEMPVFFFFFLFLIYGVSFLLMYFKYFNYKPCMDQLVIVEGTIKRRLFRSKNDDRNFRLTDVKGISNHNLLKQNKKGEVFLRGIGKQVSPYIDQRTTYYIDSKLEMILICRL